MALTASANVYVVGAADGLTWDLPGMSVEGTGNVYTFTLLNASKFKVSTVETTVWDDFNAAAYATGNTEFTAAGVHKAGGETLPVVVWTEDQMLPYVGDYTITLDLDKMTMTAYCTTDIPTEAPAVYVRGAMNDWGSPDLWKFNYDGAQDLYWFVCQGETQLNAGVEFKFADASWGSINYSTNGEIVASPEGARYDLVFNQQNSYMASNFDGLITLKVQSTTTTYAVFTSGLYEYSSVSGISAEVGEAVYYDLQGRKISNPEKGIFIQVQNGKALKVVK